MKKLPSVEQVRVSLKNGLTILDLRPNNSTTLVELRRIIKNNGFVAKEATVVARGTVSQDRTTFIVSGTDERLEVSEAPVESADAWRFIVPVPPRPGSDRQADRRPRDCPNRLKIAAAVKNARACLDVQKEFGSFDAYCWQFVDGRPRQSDSSNDCRA